jgi:hypothetical protein
MLQIVAAILPRALAIGALALIGAGCWMIYPPAAFLSVGALIWIDFSIDSFRKPGA